MEIPEDVGAKYYRVDPEFKHKVLTVSGGETLRLCYQCGTCTATCPISRFTDIFRPNKIIQVTKLGIRNVFSDAVWLCVNCYSCTERCPQGVKVSDVMRTLKNIAVKEGYSPAFSKEFAKNILNTGIAYSIPSSRLSRRAILGLPPLPKVNLEDLKKLAEVTEFARLLSSEEKGDN